MAQATDQKPIQHASFIKALRFITPIAVVLLGCSFSSPAHAWLKFCNDTSDIQNVSVGFQNSNDEWQSEGWWVLHAGECKTAIAGALERKYYYYRIKSGGESRKNDADYTFCTKTEPYTIIGDKNCERRGYHSQWFKRVNTGSSKDFTINIQ